MTTEKRLDRVEDRLDRIEAIVENNSKQIEKNTDAIIDMRLAVSGLIETANQYQHNFELIVSEIVSLRQDFTVMQSEIKGLQMENRRILDHLFGQQDNGGNGQQGGTLN